MSKRGGYRILDFAGTAFTAGTEATISGIYDRIEGNYGKRLVISGLTLGGKDYPDFEILPAVSGTSYVAAINIGGTAYTITIAEDDGITIAAVV